MSSSQSNKAIVKSENNDNKEKGEKQLLEKQKSDVKDDKISREKGLKEGNGNFNFSIRLNFNSKFYFLKLECCTCG